MNDPVPQTPVTPQTEETTAAATTPAAPAETPAQGGTAAPVTEAEIDQLFQDQPEQPAATPAGGPRRTGSRATLGKERTWGKKSKKAKKSRK